MHILFCLLGEKFKVETKTIQANFEDRVTIYDKIDAGLKGLEIGILGLYQSVLNSLCLRKEAQKANKITCLKALVLFGVHFEALSLHTFHQT